ncbi:unnamed protein product [Cylindrotheca closterium]|uniref:Uncharacterized protein n=1 Tax=Cylindrotheca closterium TaxID=2856 RepID=A0AAD2CSN9_9STRA|nr:unnamed protein product [Cylindrotheca closterium]
MDDYRRKTVILYVSNDNRIDHDEQVCLETSQSQAPNVWTRRKALQAAALGSIALLPSTSALAGVAEFDVSTGALYTPKADMLRGGSAAARGIQVKTSGQRLKPGQKFQNVYETRFIAYLSRFLLTFDSSATAWWIKEADSRPEEERFAEFAESVEIGLADYFSGPYGSYSSIQAAKAGLTAAAQAKSRRADDTQKGFFDLLKGIVVGDKERERRERDSITIGKQGILNLYTLLKIRYTSEEEKLQLAILFSFFSQPELQPTTEIRSLLGEIDNATVARVDLIKPVSPSESTSRSSSQRGGGYTLTDPPIVSVDAPPALGSSYVAAKMKPIMKPTSRVLRIRLLDGGSGYTQAPTVTISGNSERQCSVCAILDRDGHVESLVVLDPGYGYQFSAKNPPKVEISKPKPQKTATEKPRPAQAIVDMEYEVRGIDIVEPGNGYVLKEPPKITIAPPKDDPDWFVETSELTDLEAKYGKFRAVATQMRDKGNRPAYISTKETSRLALDKVRASPLELLPSTMRPELNSYGVYVISSVAAIRTYDTSPNIRFRAMDPLFGSIGKVPVTKDAAELKSGEYLRLALSGAVCTVLVRTALNPLELIKTKLQLKNDDELFQFAEDKMKGEKVTAKAKSKKTKGKATTDESELTESDGNEIGTGDLVKSVIELRGVGALFQSADITFLASLMFGSFGFGATELFRRSFTLTFFTDGGDSNSELILLLAAFAATVITSAAAAPFELLRVRSMGLVESKSWTKVLKEFLEEKGNRANGNGPSNSNEESEDSFWNDLNARDLLPLFAGFPPTASRELAFAIPKFLAFDVISKSFTEFVNANAGAGSLPVQVGVGTEGLLISAFAGALAGIAGAIVSHPADFILTKTSASKKKINEDGTVESGADWKDVVKDLLQMEGGIANLYVGLQPRVVFFFLVIGLQFFLYDYVKILLQVGSDDLSLVLDVFYAVRQGLLE